MTTTPATSSSIRVAEAGPPPTSRSNGPALDHDRYEPRCPRIGSHPLDGCEFRTTCWLIRRMGSRRSGTHGPSPPPYPTEGDVRKGFVYKRVPHVTLKSIANNPDIKDGMTRARSTRPSRHAETEILLTSPTTTQMRPRVRSIHGRKPVPAPGLATEDESRAPRAMEPRNRPSISRRWFSTT